MVAYYWLFVFRAEALFEHDGLLILTLVSSRVPSDAFTTKHNYMIGIFVFRTRLLLYDVQYIRSKMTKLCHDKIKPFHVTRSFIDVFTPKVWRLYDKA